MEEAVVCHACIRSIANYCLHCNILSVNMLSCKITDLSSSLSNLRHHPGVEIVSPGSSCPPKAVINLGTNHLDSHSFNVGPCPSGRPSCRQAERIGASGWSGCGRGPRRRRPSSAASAPSSDTCSPNGQPCQQLRHMYQQWLLIRIRL